MASIRFPYRLTLQDGTEHDVVCQAPDLLRMESRFDVVWTALLPSEKIDAATGMTVVDDDGDPLADPKTSKVKLEYIAFMAWNALRRTGVESILPDFEAFIDHQFADIEAILEPASSDPEEAGGSAA